MRTRMNKTKCHALDVFCISFALAATARTLDVTAYGAKPTAADIFRAVDGFEFINTRFSLHAKTAK